MIIEDGVEQEDLEQPKPPAGKGKEPETVTLTRAEHQALLRERDEARDSERFWASRARGDKGEDTPEPEEEPIDTDGLIPEVTGDADVDEAIFSDPDKWTEALTKGPKAVEQFVKRLGYVSAKEAAEIAVKAARQEVRTTVRHMQTDSQLVGDFADMKDPKSELFQAAAPIYQKLVAMNGGKQTTALLYAAAEAAKAKLEAKAPAKPRRGDSDEYDRYDPESERQARARAQGSNRRSAPVPDDDAGDLGPEALAICRAMDIKPEDYIASQKQLGSARRRR